jgi:hypothetical protein
MELEQEKKERYEIIDYVTPVKEYIEGGTELPENFHTVSKRFNGYDIDNDIKDRGKETILNEIENIQEVLFSEEFHNVVNSGLDRSQEIAPHIQMEPIKILFLYAGPVDDGKAFRPDTVVINMGNVRRKSDNPEVVLEHIEAYVSHEGIHIFLEQLGIKAKESKDTVDRLSKRIWEEGLTTYMETKHFSHHEDFVNDAKFWKNVILEWDRTYTEEDHKKILRKCLENQTYKKWHSKRIPKFEKRIEAGENIHTVFSELLRHGNGPVYQLGYALWKEQIDSGASLPELVQKGHKQGLEWLRSSSLQ